MSNNTIIIGVDVDTKEADKELEELKQKIEETSQEIKNDIGINGSTNGGGAPQSSPNRDKVETPTSLEQDPNSWGKTAGKIFVAEFIGKMSKQGVDVIARALTNPDGGNSKVETFTKASHGAIDGAQAGAMFGPWGAAIGGIFGGVMSGIQAEIGHNLKIIEEFKAEHLQQQSENLGKYFTFGKMASTQIERNMGSEERQEFYKKQWSDLQSGENGILQLSMKLNNLRMEKKTDTTEYKELEILRNQKKAMANEYELKYAQESLNTPFKMYEANELMDSFAQQGIQIGNQVNVDDLQKRQLDVLTEMKNNAAAILEKITQISNRGAEDVLFSLN